MYIPKLFFGLKWLKMDVLDILAMRTMDRNRCGLNRVRLAVLQKSSVTTLILPNQSFFHLARE